ncbi:hypothetical protein TWF106_008439 [Orbilia oligospora]|uniref:Uncharacterized protein n=1 Tax=Orbilia oligospora TaxID=2813651 RepID=A0A6G1LV09_ORBOL|nr:hypothetical protein TWF788_002614 [Orbilia oligospora]KAF3214042.1 hypothetical protein TWF191_009865 [Orbilia oligospora]KAF3222548.1 hypothetical protein TWF679_006018 [Orbilia oligospora]KAF3228036.1 hypothetical protein TWF106_008439 [Orbilia oligospora]KAF3234343.1 hypothetical protein TWF192_001576 [Orbilia oligospora]
MQLKFFVAAFASLALASAVALPEPQDASPPFVCGCTNACKIANKPGMLCPEYCDPKYFCPTSTTTTPTRPTLTPRPSFVCGCTNACKIACPTCICPQYCDPKYECSAAAALSIKTTKTTAAPPKPTCGCLNDCIVNCPPGENCICPQYCDPKYACPETLLTKKSIAPIPTTTGIPCGCHNDCTISCNKRGCACPAYCDPKYACKA